MTTDMDKLLKEAFDEIAKEEYVNRPTDFPEHRFSLRFRLKMRHLLNESVAGKKTGIAGAGNSILELYRPVHTKRRLAAIALLVFVLVAGTVFGAEPIIQWLNNFCIEQSEDHVMIQNNELDESVEHTKANFRKYCLTEVPEGYSLDKELFEEGFQRYTISYSKEEDVLILKQTWQEDEVAENLTSDVEDLKDIDVNGFSGYYTEDKGIGSLVLSNGIYKLVLGGPFTKNELIDLAGKLELSDEPIK